MGLLLLWIASQPARSQTVLLSEGFEGDFPGTLWYVDDADIDGLDAFWDDVDSSFGGEGAHSGIWKGYCAGFGYAGSSSNPSYQNYMQAFMTAPLDLRGHPSATLTFWHKIPDIEAGYDSARVYIDDTLIWSSTATVSAWTEVTLSLDAFVGAMHNIYFEFWSDDSFAYEGWYLDDILVTGTGGGGSLPNLIPYQPPGWSDKIVVSRTTNTTTDSTGLLPNDTLYVDWSIINNGAVSVSSSFRTELYIDDVLRVFVTSQPPMPVNSYRFVSDYNIGSLTAGAHTLKVKTDTVGVIAESNENDNEYIKTIVIGGSADIRVSPLSLTFNVTNSSAGPSAAGPAAVPGSEPGEQTVTLSPEEKLFAAQPVLERFERGEERVNVIVNLASPPGKPRAAEWDSKAKLQAWQGAVRSRQEEVLSTLGEADFKVRHRFENQSGFSGALSKKGFDKLARHPRVRSVEFSRTVKPHLAQGIPLMNGTLYRSLYNGSGVSVAIVDSGVDYTHPRLGGGGFPNSKVIGGYDYGDSDPNPIPFADAHGTACAGIAAGSLGSVGDYIGGVAPNAKIYALKVTSDLGGGANDADIIAAWNWCITHKNDDPMNPLVVISTSFGGDRYYSTCDALESAFATAANHAVNAGLTLMVSSGNEGYCDSMGSPACLSSVISVGAVFDAAYGTSTYCLEAESCAPKSVDGSCPSGFGTSDETHADKVTRYSNTASFLGVLAPAHRAYTTDIVGSGGYSSGDYATTFGGTSAACPYAAGAVAVLQSAARSVLGRFLTPAEVRATLVNTGDPILDTKTPITKPRVNLGRAIESLGQSKSFTIFNDGNAPLNVISIVLETPAPWVSLTQNSPFAVDPGSGQAVGVSIDSALAPFGESTRRLLVTSSDSDESPYPGGVFITVNRADTRPSLRASRVGDKVILSWPTNHSSGFVLQCATNLPSTAWTTILDVPALIAGQEVVTNTISGQRKFFRLKQ